MADDTEPYQPGDYREMTEGLPPPGSQGREAFVPREVEEVVDAVRLLSNRDLRIRIVVEDASTGQELWWQRPHDTYRLGQRVTIAMDLTLQASPV